MWLRHGAIIAILFTVISRTSCHDESTSTTVKLIDVYDNDSDVDYHDYEATTSPPRKRFRWHAKTWWYNTYRNWFLFADLRTDVIRACYIVATTYMNAYDDMRSYFVLRYLYVNSKEYEVGYVMQDIIARYQKLLELYYLVENRYYFKGLNDTFNAAPSTYLLYMYTNILEQSKAIIHMCNAIQELEKKYAIPPKSIMVDYDDHSHNRDSRALKYDRQREAYLKRLRRKQKELKKQRKKNLALGIFNITKRIRPPKKKSKFPIHYGWSIEY